MLATDKKLLTFEELLAWDSGRSDLRFELWTGIPMPIVGPTANQIDDCNALPAFDFAYIS